jgi:hypothetical protein
MKLEKVISIFFLSLMIGFSTSSEVRAGSPPNTSNSGGAALKGNVRVEGNVPKPKPISMAADPSCARQHSSPAVTQEVIAGAKGELQNVIVFVADGVGDRSFDPPTGPAVIDQKGCMYQPHVLAMRANQPLDVVNNDPTSHNIHPMPANNREWNKAEPPGTKLEEAFPREEIAIPVKCNIHPWMHSYVAVFKHPYFAVTSQDGTFDLSNLPPGTYTIKAWHEKFGTSSQTITIGANETKEINFVFKAM